MSEANGMIRKKHQKISKSSKRGSAQKTQNAHVSGKRAPAKAASGHWLYGIHAVQEALSNSQRRIERLLATPEAAQRLAEKGLSQDQLRVIEPADRSAIDELIGADKVHQGLALKTHPLPDLDIQDSLSGLEETEPALIIALDHVTDPHNVGAILRSASAFGARAVLTTKHNAPEETGVLAKSASGAVEHVPIVRVTNLGRSLKECQDLGFWVVGLDASGSEEIDQMELPTRCVLVLGAEGEGLRPGVATSCDYMARLPMSGRMESLNVSNAAAISMYEWLRRRRVK